MSEPRLAPIVGALPSVRDVGLRPLPPDDPASPKGRNTWNWPFPANPIPGQTMIARRFTGDAVGGHFHVRRTQDALHNKDPEYLLLITGRAHFWFQDTSGEEVEMVLDATMGPQEVRIPPYILHIVTVLSDMIIFIEQQPAAYDPKMTYNADEFELLVASLK